MKNKFNKAFIDIAEITANLSYCDKLKVGAVLVRDNRIISQGYNGTITNTDNCCEDKYINCKSCNEILYLKNDTLEHPEDNKYHLGCNHCPTVNTFTIENVKLKTKDEVIHAEQNLLLFAAREGISVKNCDLYITHSPCIDCAKFILASGIKRVYYKEEYKCNKGIDFLNKNNIPTIKL